MNSSSNEEFGTRAIQNIIDIFISPEVKRRQDAGELPKPLRFRCAQVILFPDERKPLVRINEEVKARAKVKFKQGILKKRGDSVYEDEIEAIEHVELGPDDDPDCGHIFLYLTGTTMSLWFDFRRNRALALKHVERAKEYFEIASHSLQIGSLSPFIDNLFNAAELSAKAVLLVTYDFPPSVRTKTRHNIIKIRYNRFANLGNVMPEHKSVFNKLQGLRDTARYLKGTLTITKDQANEMLDVIGNMIGDAERRIG